MNWQDYWNQDSPIYASERHKELHYQLVAEDIVGLLTSQDAVVLDYGCGEALAADRVAEKCARLYLSDAAPRVRQHLVEKFSADNRIKVLAPEDLSGLEDGSIDLIVVNSVVQYFSCNDLRSLLKLWQAKLKSGGRLVIADVIPPNLSALTDAKALLTFAWQGGFFKAAIVGLVRTALSDYRKIREEIGLSQYSEGEMATILQEAGFSVERADRNIGHNPTRMTFVGRMA